MPLFRFKRDVSFANAFGALYGGSRFNSKMFRIGDVVEESPCFGFGVSPHDVEQLPDPRDDGSPIKIADIGSGCDRLLQWVNAGHLEPQPLLCRVVADRLRQLSEAYLKMPDTPPLSFGPEDVSDTQGVWSLINLVKSLRQAIGNLRRHDEVSANGKETSQSDKGRRPRGRPRASNSELQLYFDWKAANRATGITKPEFLRERGLPKNMLAAIERGRAQAKRRSGHK
jgi:hypothetical protein